VVVPPVQPQVDVTGRWAVTVAAPTGAAVQGQLQVTAQGNQVGIVVSTTYQMQGPDGQGHQCYEQYNFTGTINGLNIVAQCNNAVWRLDGQQVLPQGLPIRMSLTVSADGRSMRGTSTNAMGASATVTAQR
jgi:hypothetical protein